MSWVQAFILALIQGLTEFLPVSSSGHLALFGKIIGLKKPDIAFDVVIHLATLFAVLIYYRKDIIAIILSLFGKKPEEEKFSNFAERPYRFLLFGILATIPTGIIGLFLKDKVESFHSNLHIVGLCFFITAIFLFVAWKIQQKGNSNPLLNYGLWLPILIGIAQGIAIMPGISRSGATITAALIFGVCAEDSAEFSFLLSIPAILGAFILEFKDISHTGFTMPYILGFFVALIVGVYSIKLVEIVVKKLKLHYFSFYLFVLAVISFLIG
ncbi:bacA undecaprenyl-diphosphatase [Thermotomaculum hydrothermale]|uniref:Undecaprenyl-diphosphatase n=1 Tax=Thermotomaculum hydrothermale TaxID=981385 RepID=A0A7R6PNU3_9BACT|nr:undecaprenyl-diphosphate phosphatase [Thermotomaculum hydrothermale]BBB33083.1 bacA undecaprenyl-diphosphatase [Thermotomaculum hydrothermale]